MSPIVVIGSKSTALSDPDLVAFGSLTGATARVLLLFGAALVLSTADSTNRLFALVFFCFDAAPPFSCIALLS